MSWRLNGCVLIDGDLRGYVVDRSGTAHLPEGWATVDCPEDMWKSSALPCIWVAWNVSTGDEKKGFAATLVEARIAVEQWIAEMREPPRPAVVTHTCEVAVKAIRNAAEDLSPAELQAIVRIIFESDDIIVAGAPGSPCVTCGDKLIDNGDGFGVCAQDVCPSKV